MHLPIIIGKIAVVKFLIPIQVYRYEANRLTRSPMKSCEFYRFRHILREPMKNPIHPPVARRHLASGITLVEILISITIIAILATLGFVIFKKAKQKALEAKAIAPMRSVAIVNAQFATENSGKINTLRWVGDPEERKGGYVTNSFWGRMIPYLFPDVTTTSQSKLAKELKGRLNGLFGTSNCDKMTGTWMQGSPIYHDASTAPVPFAFNDELYDWNKWIRTNKVSDVSQIMYITYGFGLFNEADGQTATPRPPVGTQPTNNIYYLDNKKAMVGFLDGHVEFMNAPIPQRRFK
jgi:prepilin-type processing-associated H-X9-DG protein